MLLKEDGGDNNGRFNISLTSVFNSEFKIQSNYFNDEEIMLILNMKNFVIKWDKINFSQKNLLILF